MSYIEQTRKEVIEAYLFLRTNNMNIPSETLEFMKDSSLKALDKALTLTDVVKPFYCLGDPKFGGIKRCDKQCKGCESRK